MSEINSNRQHQQQLPQMIMTLLSSQPDVFYNEVAKFMNSLDIYHLCVGFLQLLKKMKSVSESSFSSIIIHEFLDHYGYKQFKSRSQRVYARVACQVLHERSLKKNLISSKHHSSMWWIVNESAHEQMAEYYRVLSFEIFNQNSEENESLMDVKLKLLKQFPKLIHNDTFKEDMSLFEMYDQFLKFEIRYLKSNYWKFSKHTALTDSYGIGVVLQDQVMDMNIAIYGHEKSGKREMIRSYCTNAFGGNNETDDFDSTQTCNVMIDGYVFCVKMSAFSIHTMIPLVTTHTLASRQAINSQQDALENNATTTKTPINPVFVIFVYDCTKHFTERNISTTPSTSTSVNALLREHELQMKLLPALRKLVMTYPFTPIVVAMSKIDLLILDDNNYSCSDELSSLYEVLNEFPHVVQVVGFSALTQEGLKSCFDEAYKAAIKARYQCSYDPKKKDKKCEIQ